VADKSTESTGDGADGIVGLTEIKLEERVRDFSELLKSIETLDDKKRKLWTEIYENAVVDRQNSYAMFTKLVRICGEKTAEHAVHAKSMATYIAGMSKSNDQLIKLAEMIAKAQQADEEISPEDMFDKIRGV